MMYSVSLMAGLGWLGWLRSLRCGGGRFLIFCILFGEGREGGEGRG